MIASDVPNSQSSLPFPRICDRVLLWMKRRRKSKNFVPFRKKLCNNQVVRIVRHFSKRFSNSYFFAPPCNTIKTHKSLHVNETMATRPYNIRKRSHSWKLLKWTKSNVWDYWLSLKPNFNYASFYIFKRSQIGTSTKFTVDPHRLRRYHPKLPDSQRSHSFESNPPHLPLKYHCCHWCCLLKSK